MNGNPAPDDRPIAGPICFPADMPECERAYWRWVAAIDRGIRANDVLDKETA